MGLTFTLFAHVAKERGSTNAAMRNHARRILPPVASNKRKERESPEFLKPSSVTKIAKPNVVARSGTPPVSSKAPEPALSNQLLAGYLANEFLTKGTLMGQPWDPARAEAVPVSAASAELRRMKASSSYSSSSNSSQKGKAEPQAQVGKNQRYVEVADLFKADGAHLPGIINPTQLAHFLHL